MTETAVQPVHIVLYHDRKIAAKRDRNGTLVVDNYSADDDQLVRCIQSYPNRNKMPELTDIFSSASFPTLMKRMQRFVLITASSRLQVKMTQCPSSRWSRTTLIAGLLNGALVECKREYPLFCPYITH